MELPPVRLPVSSSAAIGVVALIHITLVTLVILGPLIVVATEYLGLRRRDERYDALAKRLTQILIETTVIGGIFGSALVVLLLGLFPALITTLFNIFFWPLVLQLLAGYLLNLLFLCLYYLRWEAMRERRAGHMVLGLAAGAAPLLVAAVFNAGVTFMGTPGRWPQTGNLWHGVFNPTFLPGLVHRAVASLALVGALVVAQALWRSRRGAPADGTIFEIRYGSRLAAFATLFQVLPGLWYYLALPAAARDLLWADVYGLWLGGILAGAIAVALLIVYGVGAQTGPSHRSLWAAIGLLVASLWLMGWTRSVTRGHDLIAGIMDSGQQFRTLPAPLVPTASGEALFAQNCGMCHPGLAGDAIAKARKYSSDEELKSFLRDPAARGIAMPPVQLSENELETLLRYLRQQGEIRPKQGGSEGDR